MKFTENKLLSPGGTADGPTVPIRWDKLECLWSPHGLNLTPHSWAIPGGDQLGRVWVKTPRGTYIQKEAMWQPATKPDSEQWVLSERKNGQATAGSILFYRDGENLVEVRAMDHRTGEALDLRSEQRALLQIAEDKGRDCVWLGTRHGLYRIWREEAPP